ncbi:MAG: hypothetical protein IJX89_02360 [Alphaproteobacteria bacterium]|nr:hypothetical protein [Alphaproteobacteria bacterium]
MNINQAVEKFKLLFDWTPVSVSYPSPKYMDYSDKGHVLLGYQVRVRYRHHGMREYLFTYDEEKLGMVSQERALNNAIKFYEKTMQKIH